MTSWIAASALTFSPLLPGGMALLWLHQSLLQKGFFR